MFRAKYINDTSNVLVSGPCSSKPVDHPKCIPSRIVVDITNLNKFFPSRARFLALLLALLPGSHCLADDSTGVVCDEARSCVGDSRSGEAVARRGFVVPRDGIKSGLFVESIEGTGYGSNEDTDWARMLKAERIETNTPGGIFVFKRAPRHEIRVQLQNTAAVARPLFYRFDITGYDDKNRHSVSGEIMLAPDSVQPLPLTFDTRAWPLGPYDAKLSLFLAREDKVPVYTRNLRLGVISDAVLPKARDGEFLFGLDAANTYIFDTQDKNGFAFYRVMGADILRDLHRQNEGALDVKDIGKSLARLSAENMRGMIMVDPPKDADDNRRNAALGETTGRLEELARLYTGRGIGKIRFWELGNEPDLRGFYPGTMTEYARSFEAMRAAIKKGAARSGLKREDTVVMNGGLSFAGSEGDQRSREFFRVVDGAQIDTVAYHGHGKGGESERASLERARDAAKKAGKPNLRFIETESGFSGNDRNGLMEQARTAVEKLTYAQSQGMESFIFFRLFMEGSGTEGGYGMTDNFTEPRPSVMAYRNLVERLRHHVFVKEIGFAKALNAPGIQAHLFEERDAKGMPTNRKTLVTWSETPARFAVSLRMDARTGKVSGAQNYDIFGNPSPTKTIAGNIAIIPVGIEPVFVSWQSNGPSALVAVAPSLLTVRAEEPLLVGATTGISVLARNPDTRAQVAEIRVTPFARVPIKASVSPAKITLPADGEPTNARISVSVSRSDLPLALPTWWKVFTDIDVAKLPPGVLGTLPETLAGTQNPVTGKWVSSQGFAGGQRLEIARLAGGFGEKRAALAVSTLDAPRDMELAVAASADWYMSWNVNGREVYNTLERGNESGGLADHTFVLPLKKGRNILSALVLSGSGGWNVEFGGPKERALALSAGTDPDRVEVSLVAGERVLAKQVVPLQLNAAIPALIGAAPTTLSGWMPMQPLAELGDANVSNYFVKEPEQSRWYKGDSDLSALVWLRESGENIHLFVAAKDDQLIESKNANGLLQADSLRVVIRDESGKTLMDTTTGTVGGSVVVTGKPVVPVAITREEGRTFYALTLPKTLVGDAPFRLSLSLADNDSDFLKQALTLGDDPGVRLILP